MRIVFRGPTSVVKNHIEDDEEPVTDVAVFRKIAAKDKKLQKAYDPEYALSNFVDDGTPEGKAVAALLSVGGWVRLVIDEPTQKLVMETEYHASRELTPDELAYLRRDTVGQWSDGGGGSALDEFSEHIEPYTVEFDGDKSGVTVRQLAD